MVRNLLVGSAAVWVCALSGCTLFDTTNDEGVTGRGASAVDPYGADRSKVIKLGLQQLNGCATKANGQPIGKGTNTSFAYPDMCESFISGLGTKMAPGQPMEILTDTKFFLDKLSLVQVVRGLHTDPTDMGAVMEWIKTRSNFRSLDWRNLTISRDRWQSFGETAKRQVQFSGANWQTQRDEQAFLVELIDANGQVFSSVTYKRSDLIAENSASGHTQIMWEATNVANPTSADQVGVTLNKDMGGNPIPGIFSTVVKIEFTGSAKPFTTLDVPSTITGDGAIKVTWSAMPNDPFFFPVRFVNNNDLPRTCFNATGTAVSCRYGMDSEVAFTYPAGRKHYVPGEKVVFNVSLKDSLGNYLHAPTGLPSFADFQADTANGLLYYNNPHYQNLYEWDTATSFKVTGPIQDMREGYQEGRKFFEWPPLYFVAPSLFPSFGLFAGSDTAPLASKYAVDLPPDAKPGTYILQVKGNRAWMGERVAKLQSFSFQVGPSAETAGEPTDFPGRVGNCQICHRGVLSLDNLRHGASVDVVEGCKGCHNQDLFETLLAQSVHNVHQNSIQYPRKKNDCTVCHLTRESAIRPSYAVCTTCHQGMHGDSYFSLEIPHDGQKYGNCAQACHGTATPPNAHILPAN